MSLASRPCLPAAVLQVLALADIGVGEADKVQLQGLVHALIVGPGQLAQVDFDANYIGELPCSLLSHCTLYTVLHCTRAPHIVCKGL
jgi:hypothetical protein